jgi:hypothetical protein
MTMKIVKDVLRQCCVLVGRRNRNKDAADVARSIRRLNRRLVREHQAPPKIAHERLESACLQRRF